jgi:Raf kinase inhibitor-like YbhB/YbcL family protein
MMAGMGGMAGTMMMAGSGGMAGMMMAGSSGSGMMMAGPLTYTGMFTMGMAIPAKNKCLMPVIGGGTGENKSPALSWSGGPADVKSWAVVLYDTRYSMLHWVLWDIPAMTRELSEGLASGYALTMPMGAHQVSNGPDKKGYYGPCSSGALAGTYEYRLYALNKEKLELTETSTAAQAQMAVEAAQIEKVVWAGMPM